MLPGGVAMAHYRLYTLDHETDRIRSAEDFDAPDDASANREIARRGNAAPLEMWSGARKVGRFAARPGR